MTLGFCALSASAQQLTVLLDPARGGTEEGARIDKHTAEKQVTLELANRLRALLLARNFNVVLTRDADVTVSNDVRGSLANQAKPIACLSLHATAAGKGLHLFTSALAQTAPGSYAIPWDEAQAPYAQRSARLMGELATAFGRAKIPVSSGKTWVRPLDNMQCPAVALEIAPDGEGATAADHEYENRIADTVAGALLFWRGHADVVQSILAPPALVESKPAAASGAQAAAKPTTTKTPGNTLQPAPSEKQPQSGPAVTAPKPARSPMPRTSAPAIPTLPAATAPKDGSPQ